jgi:hypothetical protein
MNQALALPCLASLEAVKCFVDNLLLRQWEAASTQHTQDITNIQECRALHVGRLNWGF